MKLILSYNVVHSARSIVLGYQSIPKIKRGSFRGRREEKWRSFRGRFGDHFRAGDHFGGCTVPYFRRERSDDRKRVCCSQANENKAYVQLFFGGGGVGGLNKYRGKCETGYPSFIGLHYNQTSQ